MGLFNRDIFLNRDKHIQDNSTFATVEDGYYEAELTTAGIGKAKTSGRTQAGFIWKISADDPKYAGKAVGNFIGLSQNGIPSDQGYEVLDLVLRGLGIKDFSELNSVPDEAVDAWFNNKMETLIKTKARLHIYDKDGYQQMRVKNIIYSPLKDESFKEVPFNPPVQATPAQPAQTNLPQVEVSVKNGDRVFVTRPDGVFTATVLMAQGQMCYVKFDNSDFKDDIYPLEKISVIKSPEEIKAEEKAQQSAIETIEELPLTAPKFEKGMMVKGKFGDVVISSGQIYKIENDLIYVQVGKQGFPCKAEDLKSLF